MTLFSVDISFEDGSHVEHVFLARDSAHALELALLKYPFAVSVGTSCSGRMA